MSTPGQAPHEAISNLLAIDEEYAAPKIVADNALQQDFEREYRRSVEDPQGFWGDIAHRFQWAHKWDHVMEWSGATHKWFVGAKLNITVNALDRHVNSDRRNKVAYIWLGEDGAEIHGPPTLAASPQTARSNSTRNPAAHRHRRVFHPLSQFATSRGW